MSYLVKSIREKWDWLISAIGAKKSKELDEEARSIIRSEIAELYKRQVSLEKLIAVPEHLRNRKIAEQMAEEAHQRLEELRRNPPEKTFEEQVDFAIWKASLTPREECRHLKGAKASCWGVDKFGGPHSSFACKDYNVGCHTFVDGRTKIWCLNGCGFVSWNGDENWTEAKRMVEQSTNCPSSSERWVPEVK